MKRAAPTPTPAAQRNATSDTVTRRDATNRRSLIRAGSRYYRRYYRLVATATVITVAVITGSLVVGDSVRTTLVRRVEERLGDTESILFARRSFLDEAFVAAVERQSAQQSAARGAEQSTTRGVLMMDGFVAHDGKHTPVTVWGVDDASLPRGGAQLNLPLARELGVHTTARRPHAGHPLDIVLRLPAEGLVPSGSLFVTDTYTTALRLRCDSLLNARHGGNLSLRNEQTLPYNLFVNRAELAATMGVDGKINLLLSSRLLTPADLDAAWSYRASGITLRRTSGFTEIASDRLFLPDEVTRSITARNHASNRLFSYLANSLEGISTTSHPNSSERLPDTADPNSLSDAAHRADAVPYSFVTALDTYDGEPLAPHDLILADYTARRLRVGVGDSVRMCFFTAGDLKRLRTDSVTLCVKRIVPLAALQADTTLTARFPGMTDATRCTDWNSDLPIDLSRITAEDELYWERYRSTPKALVSYAGLAPHWRNAYGNATAVRVSDSVPDLSLLRPEMMDIHLIHPREAGIYAASHGVDFSSLFLALGCFIIVSALLLLVIPTTEMLYRRRGELALLDHLGYTRRRITALLWREAAPVVAVAAVGGVVVGLLYTTVVMWLLGNVWQGATHTDGFAVYPNWLTLLIGLVVGTLLSLAVLRRVLVRRGDRPHTPPALRPSAKERPYTFRRHIVRLLQAGRRQNLRAFLALALGVLTIFAVGLHRQGFNDSTQLRQGTFGYSLWCESTVPVYHDLSTREGRAQLSLTDLPDTTQVLQCLRYSADEASCLNLNKVSTPTVLGVDLDALPLDEKSRQAMRHGADGNGKNEPTADSTPIYPALVDATVLTWSLGKSLGDTLYYTADDGRRVGIRLAATLPNTIFQGNILVARADFSRIWRSITGSEVILLRVPDGDRDAVKNLMEQALNEYGMSVTTTGERLRQFNSVTDTYLTIFMTLGGLGLLLGIMTFVIVVRRNLLLRRQEIALYRTLGFTDRRIIDMLYRENRVVPLAAIAVGVAASLLSISFGFAHVGVWLWLTAGAFVLLFIGAAHYFVRRSVERTVLSSSEEYSQPPPSSTRSPVRVTLVASSE